MEEGADIVMVKPALAYLDVIRMVSDRVRPAGGLLQRERRVLLVKHAAAAGLVDEARIVWENLHAMARAGADILITYHGRDALKEQWI